MQPLTRKQVLAQGHEVFVAGIPCLALVTFYSAGETGRYHGAWEDCYPSVAPELEFELYDRKGYPAAWLERKLTADDVECITYDIFEAWRREARDAF